MIFDDLAVSQFPTDPVRLEMTFTNHPPAAGSCTVPKSSFKVMAPYTRRCKKFPQVLMQCIVCGSTRYSFMLDWHIDWSGIETYGSSKICPSKHHLKSPLKHSETLSHEISMTAWQHSPSTCCYRLTKTRWWIFRGSGGNDQKKKKKKEKRRLGHKCGAVCLCLRREKSYNYVRALTLKPDYPTRPCSLCLTGHSGPLYKAETNQCGRRLRPTVNHKTSLQRLAGKTRTAHMHADQNLLTLTAWLMYHRAEFLCQILHHHNRKGCYGLCRRRR